MALSEDRIRKYTKRLLLSRMRILCNHGFYGLLLMHMQYAVREDVETACTDGVKITFGSEFLDSISDSELDFVMMHEILHVVLQHATRGGSFDDEAFNIAADIVVNSNILLENGMNTDSITLEKYGTSMHIAPDGREGYEYTAEQVCTMLGGISGKNDGENRNDRPEWDDHSQWGKNAGSQTLREVWAKRFQDAAAAIEIRDPSNARGLLPAFAQRILKDLRSAKTDWRILLNDFIQEEVTDYSFSPPDRRFGDSPFFLPDFSGKEDRVEDILFMIDTSGSMSDDMITRAYSEVKGAIDQFDGKLKGWLGFFDAAVIEPVPFKDENEFRAIRPAGGGGTDFKVVFHYVMTKMADRLPASIIVLTDGFAAFPEEKSSGGIPVLWLINNETVNPPWGKTARIEE